MLTLTSYLNNRYTIVSPYPDDARCEWVDGDGNIVARNCDDGIHYLYPYAGGELPGVDRSVIVSRVTPSKASSIKDTYADAPAVARAIVAMTAESRAIERKNYMLAQAALYAERVKPRSIEMVALILRLEINGRGGHGGRGGPSGGTARLLPGGTGRRNASDGDAWLAAAQHALRDIERNCATINELELLVDAVKDIEIRPYAQAYALKLLHEDVKTVGEYVPSERCAQYEQILSENTDSENTDGD
jgi:hypothetical protein